MPDSVALGIPELDRELVGALPPGWLALLEGRAGSGVPLLAKQFAQAVVPKLPVYFYTAYEQTGDVERVFRTHGWPTEGFRVVNLSEEYFDRVLRRDLEVSQTRERGLSVNDLLGPQPPPVRRRIYNLENRLLADLAGIETPFRLVLDSIDFLLEVLSPAEVMVVARQILHLCQLRQGQALLVMPAEAHGRAVADSLDELADLILDLRSDLGPRGPEHLLTIRKVRNHPELTQVRRMQASAKGLALVDLDASAP